MFNLPQRIQDKIFPEPMSGCWLWTAFVDEWGYSRIHFHDKWALAHRVIYKLIKGAIPDGLVIDHLCRVRMCVNPDHLEPVTKIENDLRGFGVGVKNKAKTHCGKGHEFDLENTYISPKHGRRGCRKCSTISAAAYRKRNGL